jgi:hypothetical protein
MRGKPKVSSAITRFIIHFCFLHLGNFADLLVLNMGRFGILCRVIMNPWDFPSERSMKSAWGGLHYSF